MSSALQNDQFEGKLRVNRVIGTISESSGDHEQIPKEEKIERRIYSGDRRELATKIFELHKSLVHPAIRRPLFIEEVEQNGEQQLALAYRPVASESLAQVLIHTKHFMLPDIRRVFRSVLDALEAAHAVGIHHGGIQPKHFRFSIDGQHVFVDGFGAEEEAGHGSPYDPSEPDDGGWPGGPECGAVAKDLYAVAVILFQCLAGRTPLYAQKRSATAGLFQLRTLRNIDDPDQWARLKSHIYLIPGLDAFFRRALSTSCGHRFENAAEMREHLLSLKNRWLPCEKGNIELVAFLGRGGFGEVFRGRLADGQDVAVKRLIYARAERRFLQEAKVMQLLTSPRIVRYIDLIYPEVSGDGSYYLVMELLDGMPGALLRNRIRAARSGMPIPEALEVFANYLLGLERMHDCNIVHRDIKPANLYAPRHRPADGKLFDLGIVHDSNSSMTRGVVPGTWEYKAPEFIEAGFRGSPQSDIYSLGLCLYQALTGRSAMPTLREFEGPEEAAWLDRVSRKRAPDLDKPIFREYPSIAKLIRKSVCHNPRKRYPDTRAMLEEVVQALESCTGVSHSHYLETADPATTDTHLLTELSRSLGDEPASWTDTRTFQTVHDSNFPGSDSHFDHAVIEPDSAQELRNGDTPQSRETSTKPIGATRFKSTTARNFALSGTVLILVWGLFTFIKPADVDLLDATLISDAGTIANSTTIPDIEPPTIDPADITTTELPAIPVAAEVVEDPAVRKAYVERLAAITVPLNPSAEVLADIRSELDQLQAEQPTWFEAEQPAALRELTAEENWLSRIAGMPSPVPAPTSTKEAVALQTQSQAALKELADFPQRQEARRPALQNARDQLHTWLEQRFASPPMSYPMKPSDIAQLDEQVSFLAPLLSFESTDGTWPKNRERLQQMQDDLTLLRPFSVDLDEVSFAELEALMAKANQANTEIKLPQLRTYLGTTQTNMALKQGEKLAEQINNIGENLDLPPDDFKAKLDPLKTRCENLPGGVQDIRSKLLNDIKGLEAENAFRSRADIAAFEQLPVPHPDQLACAREHQLAPVVKTRTNDFVLRLIPSGETQIGSVQIGSNNNESPVFHVDFSAPFYVGVFEITVAQWNRVMGGEEPPAPLGNLPKRHVSWHDAQAFCAALCEQAGVPPGTYALLSEFEWEYAARAGTRMPFHNGNAFLAKEEACFDCSVPQRGREGCFSARVGPVPVGSFAPNPWGLFDMHGNVAEWVDGLLFNYQKFEGVRVSGKVVERGAGSQVVRGGAFDDPAGKCRSSFRESQAAKNQLPDTGFRIKRLIYLPQQRQLQPLQEPRPANKE